MKNLPGRSRLISRPRFARRAAPALLAAAVLSMVTPAAAAGESAADAGPPDTAEDNHDLVWVPAPSEHFLLYASGGVRVARRTLLEAERALGALPIALEQCGHPLLASRPLACLY